VYKSSIGSEQLVPNYVIVLVLEAPSGMSGRCRSIKSKPRLFVPTKYMERVQSCNTDEETNDVCLQGPSKEGVQGHSRSHRSKKEVGFETAGRGEARLSQLYFKCASRSKETRKTKGRQQS
jgi:hypothetical protein